MQMLYRVGSSFRWEGRDYDLLTIEESKIDEALAQGWFMTAAEAVAAAESPKDESSAPPTRAELEQKATELRLKFDGRTSNAKLAAMIEEALK